jgi:pimeloyl-ACP methyl ester carboxylesterase
LKTDSTLNHLNFDPKLSAPLDTTVPTATIDDTFAYEGARIHFKDLGIGKAIVFIHGFGFSMDTWRFLIEDLRKEFRLVRLDLKGHGYSDRPRDRRYSVQDHADIVIGLMEHLKLTNAVLVGHSLGSGVALLAALKDLNRRTGLVSGLVLVGGSAYPEKLRFFVRWLGRPVIGWLAMNLTSAAFRTRIGLRGAFYDDAKVTASLVELYAKYQRIPGTGYAFMRTVERFVPSDMDSIRREFGKLQIPVVSILGEHDKVISRSTAEGLCKLLPRCSLMMVGGVGHVPQEEKAEEMVHLIREFMTNRPSPAGGG